MTKIKDKEVAIVNAISKTLELLKKDPSLMVEAIIQKVMLDIRGDTDSKVAAIAAINSAVKIKSKEAELSNREIIERVSKELKISV
jgi:hypothetical protein